MPQKFKGVTGGAVGERTDGMYAETLRKNEERAARGESRGDPNENPAKFNRLFRRKNGRSPRR